MPFWQIFHTPTAFADLSAKAALVRDITAFYVSGGLPDFYVVVVFRPMTGEDMWVGGKPAAAHDRDSSTLRRPFVRLVISHLAVQHGPNDAALGAMTDRINKWLVSHLEWYDWEYTIDEPPRGGWRINGLAPPPHGTDAEKKWAAEAKPSPWE
ncbi:Uu.00g035140.m01.CDS01 [Anthostomella pinea]|uniref:Uu.00g035140.m01.CDS01 n=1 Tax=Anthostomella pinea TaxID=933095 RepID=A0AAI8V967_9PEZI|nr:Uu.00g035140.m01.CDS01 [Anthostomella pinea]